MLEGKRWMILLCSCRVNAYSVGPSLPMLLIGGGRDFAQVATESKPVAAIGIGFVVRSRG